MKKALIIDDEPSQRELLCAILEREGFRCVSTHDGRRAPKIIEEEHVCLVLTDMRMPALDGLATLSLIREHFPAVPVVMVTAHGDVSSAVEAMKRGADDFMEKPIDIVRLKSVVTSLVEGGGESSAAQDDVSFVGVSDAAIQVRELCALAAETSATVLITGESGTGKEVVSRAIHDLSVRAAEPFVAINCAAVPEQLLESELFGHEKGSFTDASATKRGKFEHVGAGTVLLDEIGEMSPGLQSKLLRVLQERVFERVGGAAPIPMEARLIAATNVDVIEALDSGALREDLFYRLNVLRIEIPPLRDRREDIVPLAQHFLERHGPGRPMRLTESTMRLLCAYDWPGNARELENTVERALLFAKGSDVLPEHLPPQLGGRASEGHVETGVRPGWSLQEVERDLIEKTLRVNSGNRTTTAKALGMSRRSLQIKLKRFGIS